MSPKSGENAPCRFPKTARLGTAADFRRVFARPVRSTDDYFTVQALSGHAGRARLGLAIAKRHVRRAVDRNRLKRIAREVFRHEQMRLAGIDFVVSARAPAATAQRQILAESLRQHFERLHGRIDRTDPQARRGARTSQPR
ncbi:MAG: ribonuclease P protein component [Chromatiaceae bacterium]|nr:ribonuclease P protein component [Gammaproteobacteria bacterium]MCP5304996.1 ribonuclease P protein component [Chromatiaceae bacterium]MCP5314955.1 ribonuclease P protein component [Chromatiaceae bacterium]